MDKSSTLLVFSVFIAWGKNETVVKKIAK